MWNSTGPDSNQPSPGITVDYGNPKDIYWTLNIAMTSVFTILTTVFFTMRAYVRLFIRKQISIEDCKFAISFNTEANKK